MAEQETEFKYLLSLDDYQKVGQALGRPERERRFINRYFTVVGGTDRRDWVLRLRVEGEPADWSETEPVRVLRAEVSTAPIVEQGESRNLRQLYPPPVRVGRVWELDKCELPQGRQFCELEVEVEAADVDSSAKLLMGWLESLGVSPQPSEKTKYARFLASLKGSG